MIGINTAKYKLYAFVLSTFFAGLAGAIYTHFLRYISVSVFAADNSFKPLMMSVIGGLGTIEGPIIGSVIMVFIDTFLPNIDGVLQLALSPFFPAVSNVGPPVTVTWSGHLPCHNSYFPAQRSNLVTKQNVSLFTQRTIHK